MREFSCTGNRHDKRLLVHQPSQHHLCRGNTPCASEGVQHLHDTGVGTNGFRLETGQGLAVVVGGVEQRVFVNHATEETSVQRTVRYEADAQFLTKSQYSVFLHRAVHKVIFALDSRNRTYLVRTANGFGIDLTHSPMQDFTLFDKFSDYLNRCIGICTVLVEHTERFHTEITQGVFAHTADV